MMTRSRSVVTSLLAVLLVAACSGGSEPSGAPSSGGPDEDLPAAPVEDTVALISPHLVQDDLQVEPVATPQRLVLPSVTVVVDGVQTLDVLTGDVVGALTEASADDGEEYRPADGQAVHAWRVTFEPGPAMSADVFAPFEPEQSPRDASATVRLDAGGDPLPVVGEFGPDELTFECPELPCAEDEPAERILLATVDADSSPALVATVDGEELRLDLATGEVTGDVSLIAQDGAELTFPHPVEWPLTTYVVRTPEQLEAELGSGLGDQTREGARVVYQGRFEEVVLTPFDRARGWAPSGQAWLVVPVEDPLQRVADGWWEATLDLAASWVLQHDGATLPAAEPVDSGAPVVFLVPDDLEAATLVYQPTGTVSTRAPDTTYEFQVDEPLTAELSLS